jgi:hypothetical protein
MDVRQVEFGLAVRGHTDYGNANLARACWVLCNAERFGIRRRTMA